MVIGKYVPIMFFLSSPYAIAAAVGSFMTCEYQ